jgi:DNA polymerase elongation subunit (family B)
MLDHKHKLIDLAIYLAYHFRVNFEDVFQQVRMWDAGIYNKLASMGISIPQNRRTPKKEQYVGAYVKAPQTGMHHCVASFDLNSLYPHLIMQYNIGPDTIVEAKDYSAEMLLLMDENITVDKLLNKEIDTSCLKANKVTLTPNGQFFTVGKRGFLAEMMEDMYNSRSAYKKKSIDAKKLLEKEIDPLKREEIENTIAHYNTLQMAMKVSLNSAYGALGNEYFRFFDVRQASAITTSGQLAIQWIEKKLNGYLNKLLSTNNRDYVIASDTDSVYLTLDELVRKTFAGSNDIDDPRKTIAFMDRVCEIKLQPFINKSYEELAEYTNALTQKMQMKRESLADKGLWTAKKRYVLNVYNVEGVEYAKPKIKVTGLEMIKSSTPAACREKLWEALDILLNKNEETMIDFIEQFRKDFRTLPILDIAFPRGMNNLEEYSEEGNTSESLFDEEKFTTAGNKTPIHVRGAIVYNELLRSKKLSKKYPTIKEGEKLKFIYLKQPNIIRSNVISLPQIVPVEFGLEKIIDYDLQFEKSFLEPLKVLLNLIDWKTEQTNTLEAFFG